MTDHIEPALSAEAWVSVQAGNDLPHALGSSILDELCILEGRDIPAAIAYLNGRLPDSDPRKITRAMSESILAAADWIDGAYDSPSETEARKPWWGGG